MPDVVEHGPVEDERSSLRPGASRLAVVLALAVVAFLLSQSGLLSADPPERGDRPPVSPSPTVPLVTESSRLIASVDDHLVRIGQDDWSEGARLPGSGTSGLVPVRDATGTGYVVGVHAGRLFRVVTSRTATWKPLGRARAVLAASTTPGGAVVWQGRRVVEVDVSDGRVLDDAPFPGFDASDGWSAEGLVSVTGTRALLMSRVRPSGTRQELALAWPAVRVNAAFNPAVQPLGTFGILLGIADDWILVQGSSCPGPACRIEVVTVTRDDVLVREVVAPEGWAFLGSPSTARTHEALVPVQRLDESQTALARLVAGGDNALLVRGTEGVDLHAGLVEALSGAIYLVTRTDGPERVRAWRPEQPGGAGVVAREDALPQNAQLVCVCG